MKCTMNENLLTKENVFPKLMKSKKDGYLVYMIGTGSTVYNLKGFVLKSNDNLKGFVLKSNDKAKKQPGYYSPDWSTNNFEDYNGSITLENN